MTRIDVKRFSKVIKEFRDDFERDVENGVSTWAEYGEYLAIEIKHRRHLWQPAAPRTADDLENELHVAAARAQHFGATKAQQEEILRLAIELNDFVGLAGGLLTKQSASKIITDMRRRIDQ